MFAFITIVYIRGKLDFPKEVNLYPLFTSAPWLEESFAITTTTNKHTNRTSLSTISGELTKRTYGKIFEENENIIRTNDLTRTKKK